MDVADLVRQHYAGDDLASGILAALAAAGADTDHLTVAQLGAVDQLHAGFVDATRHLLAQLELGPDSRLLDVGCGIGGPARMAAAERGCQVTGVDLSPDFVAAARTLTSAVGLSDRVTFRLVDADDLGVEDGAFDAAMLVHVGMSVPDKGAVFGQVRRALRERGRFVVFEQMRVGEGELPYPLPWAEDDRSSFVATPDAYVEALTATGFRVLRTDDRSSQTVWPSAAAPAAGPPPVTPMAVFGPRFGERIGNNIAAARSGLLAPVLILAEAV